MKTLVVLSVLVLSSIASADEFDFFFAETINPFTTDGCTQFFDGPRTGQGHEWLHCCEQHDVKYWAGIGGETAHERADNELYQCIHKAGFPGYALTMYRAVRAATPVNTHINVSYRWGYGWPYVIHNELLTPAQVNSVKQMTTTITTGIANYRNHKGYPAPTQKQEQEMQSLINQILTF